MTLKKNLLLTLKWVIICLIVGILSGCASAFFLITLEWITQFRLNHSNIIWFLPLGGLAIGLLYHFYGSEVVKGNNLLLEEYANPDKKIPFKMAPLVLVSTLITHLFGGSAGREGTAVQMAAAIANQFKPIFKLTETDRRTLIIIGISSGFASVFGTPLAGAIFALEILYFNKISLKSTVLSFLTAYIAYYTVEFWQIAHTHYSIPIIPTISMLPTFWCIIAGIIFGFSSMLFARSTHFWENFFSKYIQNPPLRPFIGGLILCVVIFYFEPTKYIGLGLPVILEAFTVQNQWHDFLIKILFTGFTLGAGFKGGEVTPLFFIGATLGSALSFVIPLPIALLAGMGFVAVFSGATHTPIACAVMGVELFGIQTSLYITIACAIAYFSSGMRGIYSSQNVQGLKYMLYKKFK